MAHLVESMMYAGEEPWHGLGVYVGEEAVTSARAIELAGLDWEVNKGPLFAAGGRPYADLFSLTRSTDGMPLGVAGKVYEPIFNRHGFGLLDYFVQDGVAGYETAISLDHGKRVVMLVKLENDMVIKLDGDVDDHYNRYLLGVLDHTGRGAYKVYETDVRVVCANTLEWAIARNTPLVRVPHKGNVDANLLKARDLLRVVNTEHEKRRIWLQQLARTPVVYNQSNTIQEAMFGSLDEDTPTRRKNAIEAWRAMLDEEVSKTGLNAYAFANSVTGYADHGVSLRKQDDGSQNFVSVLEGTATKIKAKGFAAIEELTGVAHP